MASVEANRSATTAYEPAAFGHDARPRRRGRRSNKAKHGGAGSLRDYVDDINIGAMTSTAALWSQLHKGMWRNVTP